VTFAILREHRNACDENAFESDLNQISNLKQFDVM
jgi:hypothetical protein